MSEALVMRAVTKQFSVDGRRFPILSGVDLTVEEGRLLLLLGRSGSGKTTLLSLAGALDRPDEGAVLVNGTDVTSLRGKSLYAFRQSTVGWVFQTSGLLPLLTAVENVALALGVQGRPLEQCVDPAREALRAVGLQERAEHRAHELSGGEQQRVAIARALVKGPRLLLADEPTGHLDTETGREIVNLLREATAGGTTVIMATHDATLAAAADRAVTIADGRLVLTPSPETRSSPSSQP
jgi:putative ABC transport system ATP-binding protein